MKNTRCIILAALFLIFSTGAGAVTAFTTPESIVTAGNVYVSNITFDPGSFFTNDAGIVTVYVTNGNPDQSVVVNHVTIGDKNIRLTSTPYDSSSNIGPLQTKSFVFSVSLSNLLQVVPAMSLPCVACGPPRLCTLSILRCSRSCSRLRRTFP